VGFRGTFYIAHVSNPLTVDYIEAIRKNLPFEVVMEITFHHMFLNTSDYKIQGNRVKMNPPLRPPDMQQTLLNYVLQGKFDVIGTDHAPHPIERKDSEEPPSGIRALPFWPRGIELLRKEGIKEVLLEDMIFHKSNQLFKLGLRPKMVTVDPYSGLWETYGQNTFSRLYE